MITANIINPARSTVCSRSALVGGSGGRQPALRNNGNLGCAVFAHAATGLDLADGEGAGTVEAFRHRSPTIWGRSLLYTASTYGLLIKRLVQQCH